MVGGDGDADGAMDGDLPVDGPRPLQHAPEPDQRDLWR